MGGRECLQRADGQIQRKKERAISVLEVKDKRLDEVQYVGLVLRLTTL